MAKMQVLLNQAIRETRALQDPESEAYRAWLEGSRNHSFPSSVLATASLGSYPTTNTALEAVAAIANTLLDNEAEKSYPLL
jgi:hypothetical protein